MSRFCGDKDRSSTLEAAEYWRDECLLNNNSIFGGGKIWTPENIKELVTYYVKNLDSGEGDFNQKLAEQLAAASEKAKQLAAEMMWVMLLCPSNIKPPKKRENINAIMKLANKEVESDHRFLSEGVLSGIGSGGPGYNQYKWNELVYCINFTKTFFKEDLDKRRALVSDSRELSQWLERVEDNENRQFRHMLLYLLFPDDHERIFGRSDRLTIAEAFSARKTSELKRLSSRELDEFLGELRAEQVSLHGTDKLDWYVSPLREKWQDVSTEVGGALDKQSVLQAIDEIKQRGVRTDERSSTYDLIYNGDRYPPKLVYSFAHKYTDGKALDRATFEGGENTLCFKMLRELGFYIEKKNFVSELLNKFIQQADKGESQITKDYPKKYCGLDVSVSFGQGNFSKIPWVTFLGYGQKTQKGIYPVILYYKPIKVLVFAYGISATNSPEIEWRFDDNKETIRDFLKEKYDFDENKYKYSFVYSAYQLPTDLSDPKFSEDLDALCGDYHSLMAGDSAPPRSGPPKQVPSKSIMNPGSISSSFSQALKSSHVDFGGNHEGRVRAFIASLMTKPLVNLTGLSGSGKTQIAIRFGEWLGKDRMLVAPVRPDWTGAEALFGYEDALKPIEDSLAAWAVPDTLQFFLKAASDPDYPYLLVLDEMNLAHVERYFADVLSGMESSQPCLPNLVQGEDGYWRLKKNEPDKIALPDNVFIVGTVNVDETTYMFSPKVLDRANTFEFRVTTDDLSDNYRKPIACEMGDERLIRGFLEIGRDSNWQAENVISDSVALSVRMRQIHNLLAAHGFEFGHRVFYESQRFSAIYGSGNDADLSNVLDLIIMQKLLPRLHGSRRRLEDLIRSLAKFCFTNPDDTASESPVTMFEPDDHSSTEAKLPISFDKLKRMLRSLRANQFTSFTE